MLEVTEGNFATTVSDNDTVVLDFWAEWCGPCRQFAPIFEKVAEEHGDVVFGKVNVDEQQRLAGAMGAMSIPTVVAFRGGAMVYNQAGAMNATAFADLVSKIKAVDLEEVKRQVAEMENKGAEASAE